MPSGRISRNAGERHAHLPAAGEQADVAVHAFLAEAQARQHFARTGIKRIAIEFLEAVLHLAIARDEDVHVFGLVRIGHRGFELAHFGGQRARRSNAVHHRHRRRSGPTFRRHPG
jgi:hypothetical protein